MGWYQRISDAFRSAPVLPMDHRSRFILISDCHRGTGNSNDNFLKNQYLYLAALKHYYQRGFTYIELGDGDELWENRSLARIIDIHSDVFRLLKKFHCQKRLYMLYGNHDHCKKNHHYCRKHCSACHCQSLFDDTPHRVPSVDRARPSTFGDTPHRMIPMNSEPEPAALFPKLQFLPGIILYDTISCQELYLTHGHQADFLNSTLAPLACFLVRYLWKPLEAIGVCDPTSAARNYMKKQATEKRLAEWARRERKLLITGHTHRPMAGSPDSPYFNTGSCVHPGCVTCIEIENRRMTLVKWLIETRKDLSLYAAREELAPPVSIEMW